MTKRTLLIEIDCEDETCGKCLSYSFRKEERTVHEDLYHFHCRLLDTLVSGSSNYGCSWAIPNRCSECKAAEEDFKSLEGLTGDATDILNSTVERMALMSADEFIEWKAVAREHIISRAQEILAMPEAQREPEVLEEAWRLLEKFK